MRTAVVLALAAGLLAVFLRHANLPQVGVEIRRGRVDLLLAALAAVAATYVTRAVRWQYLLRPIGPARFRTAFRTTVIGFAVSAVLPVRVGEVLRPYLLARREGLSATATFATIVLERLLDTIMVLLLLASFVLLFDPGMTAVSPAMYGAIKVGGLGVGALSLAALAAIRYLSGHPARLDGLLAFVERRVPAGAALRMAALVRAFVEGLAVVRTPGRLLAALVLSLPLWLSIATSVWLVPVAFGIAMPFTGSFLLLALLVVGVAVPTPGGVGGFHEAFRIGATVFFGAPNDKAVGAAILLHAVSFLPVTVVGLLFMMQEGLNLERARRMAGSGPDEGTGA